MLGGIAAGALVAGCFDFCAYRMYVGGRCTDSDIPSSGYREVLAISLPVTAGALLRSVLVLTENMLIPRTLASYGVDNAMGEYGIIKGMSIPLMLFPAVFSSSFSQLLVAEMSERRAEHKPNGIRYIAGKACGCTLYFGFFIAGSVVLWHREIAGAFYGEPKVGIYFGMLSLLVVPMYLDTVVDGMLKGLNQQMSSLRYNIADSVLRVCLILCLIPVLGPRGYIGMLYISEIFNLRIGISMELQNLDIFQ
jgi:stage V sporulation protein B